MPRRPIALARPLLGAVLAALVALVAPPAAHAQRPQRPQLVVLLAVDQLPHDALLRLEPRFTGGLARLLRAGAVFRGLHDHANTETAPGHSVMLAGRFPRSTGILANEMGIQDPQVHVLGSRDEGASPWLFRGTTLFDWMRFDTPGSRALSVSRKDRSAILPIGRNDQEVYWYAWESIFTTSSWYADTLPAWVQRFNARRLPQSYAGATWRPLQPEREYRAADSVAFENNGAEFTFPHRLPADPVRAARELREFPMMDEVTLAFALEGVRELKLGAGADTDLLAVSLSTTDAVGHRFGPASREYEDQLLRVDRMLGAFLDTLFAWRDSSRVVLALTSDHGVAPMPAWSRAHGHPAARTVNVERIPGCARCVAPAYPLDAIRARMRAAGVDTAAIGYWDGILLLDRARFAGRPLSPDSVVRDAERALRALPGVLRVDRVASLASRDTVKDAIARRWIHMLPPDLPAELVVTFLPYVTRGDSARAQHGSPHEYDAAVPVIFWGAPFRPLRPTASARVVDIAPTLAAALGLIPSERLDGRVLEAALHGPPRAATRRRRD